jgi:hypothetical protein
MGLAHGNGVIQGIGVGVLGKTVYDNSTIKGKLQIDKAGAADISGSVQWKDSVKISGQYSSNNAKVGIEKVNYSIDSDGGIPNVTTTDSILSSSGLSSFTETLIQVSLVLGLSLEFGFIGFIIYYCYKNGVNFVLGKVFSLFNNLSIPPSINFTNLLLLLLIIWVSSINIALNSIVDHSLFQTTLIKDIYSIIEDIKSSI